MTFNSAALICFSPTGTKRKVLDGIAQGIHIPQIQYLDLTPHDAMNRQPVEIQNELAIIGSPVHGGRLPEEAVSGFRQIRGNNTPAVIVVVYGNRAYEDALLELKKLALELGFRPIAAAAFIGEHSYSSTSAPIAAGRPDADDLGKAKEFGGIIKTLTSISVDEIIPVRVPGNFPYKEWKGLSNISPVTDESVCSKCSECASACPTAAITVGDAVATDATLCIRCCACVKTCSTGARTMEDPRIKQAADQLSKNCSERKEPETYI